MSKRGNSNRDKPTAKHEPEGITEIRVGGFKSIVKPQAIEVRPLTILAGANSSGKTSFIQPLLLLKQTLEAPYDPGPLLLDGPNVKVTSGDQIISRLSSTPTADHLEVAIRALNEGEAIWAFKHHPGKGFDVEMLLGPETKPVYIRPGMKDSSLRAAWPYLSKWAFPGHRISVTRDRCFLNLHTEGKDSKGRKTSGDINFRNCLKEIRGAIHVPGWRGSPERSYPVTAVGSEYPGTFDKYVASLISHWQTKGNQKLLDNLNRQLGSIGLTSQIAARSVTEVQVELRVARMLHDGGGSSNDLVNIADVGFGVSQALPVLVALLVASPGQLVYIEEPELHLHPRAQVGMANVLAEAAGRGVKVIAETHSSLLLRAVQTLVAKGELDPKLVKLHWFTRNEKDGATEVRSADLDADGAFGDWPTDFDDVELRSEGDYLDAVGRRSKA